MSNVERYFGKYRGIVVADEDPECLGRLQVECPSLLGEDVCVWAMPCVPYAGPGVGLFAPPPVDAGVWVEFEGGDLTHPIWSGCFWHEGEAPISDPSLRLKVLKTEGLTLTLDESPGAGGIRLELGPPLVSTTKTWSLELDGPEASETSDGRDRTGS